MWDPQQLAILCASQLYKQSARHKCTPYAGYRLNGQPVPTWAQSFSSPLDQDRLWGLHSYESCRADHSHPPSVKLNSTQSYTCAALSTGTVTSCRLWHKCTRTATCLFWTYGLMGIDGLQWDMASMKVLRALGWQSFWITCAPLHTNGTISARRVWKYRNIVKVPAVLICVTEKYMHMSLLNQELEEKIYWT